MGELDDLAEAANRQRSARKTGAGTVVRRGRGGILFFIAGLAVAGTIAGVTYYAGRDSHPKGIADLIRDAVVDRKSAVPSATSADPKFRLSEENYSSTPFVWSWIEVVNEDTEPLTVNAIVLNGEFPAQPAQWFLNRAEPWFSIAADSKDAEALKPFPHTLSIGETLYAMEYRPASSYGCYYRRVIFIDIYTDRGNYRFRDGELAGEAPPLDAPKMAAIDERIREDVGAADAEQSEIIRRAHLQQEQDARSAGGGGTPNN